MLLDDGPRICIGNPGMRGGLLGSQRRRFIVVGDAARIDFADLDGLAVRGGVDWFRAICKGDDDAPGFGGGVRIAPYEGWRKNVWREN
jgi:hypothetical protein